MSIKEVKGSTRHQVYLRQGDFTYLATTFRALGASGVIRAKISALVDELKARPPAEVTDDLIKAIEKESTDA